MKRTMGLAAALAAILMTASSSFAFAAKEDNQVSLKDINDTFADHFQGKDKQGRVQASDNDGVQAEENYWNYMGASGSRAVDNNFKDQKAWFKSLSPTEQQTLRDAVRSASSDLGIQTQPASLDDINNAYQQHFGKVPGKGIQAKDAAGIQAEKSYWEYIGDANKRSVDGGFSDQRAWFNSLTADEQQKIKDAVKKVGMDSGLSTSAPQPVSLQDINKAFEDHFQGKDSMGGVQASDQTGIDAETNFWKYINASNKRAIAKGINWWNSPASDIIDGKPSGMTNGQKVKADAETWWKKADPDKLNGISPEHAAQQWIAHQGAEGGLVTGQDVDAKIQNVTKNMQPAITQSQIDSAKNWVTEQIKETAPSNPPYTPPADGTDYDHKQDSQISDNTAAASKAQSTAAKAQGTADHAQSDATKALTGGANDSTARKAAANAQTEADQNKGNIAQNHSDIDKNSGLIAEMRGSIGDDNFRQVSVQQHLADMNQTVEDTSKADRAYTDQVGQNTLKSANAYTDEQINGLSRKVDHLKSRIDSGVAGATALASIPFSSLTKNSFGGSVASANSKAAGAVGYQRNFGRHWSARGTVAFGDHYTQGGVGGTFNW